eukprot:jgi/Chlat1/7176/Chrsp57S09127
MVLKTETCRFSGLRIYPGHGMRYVRGDSQMFVFLNAKCKRYFHLRLKPAKLAWTVQYRKSHKKGQVEEVHRKKRRANSKPYQRSIVGASLEVIQKRRAEKPEVRAVNRDAALREVKERAKKTKEEKRVKKVETQAKAKTTSAKAPTRSQAPKAGAKVGKR